MDRVRNSFVRWMGKSVHTPDLRGLDDECCSLDCASRLNFTIA